MWFTVDEGIGFFNTTIVHSGFVFPDKYFGTIQPKKRVQPTCEMSDALVLGIKR